MIERNRLRRFQVSLRFLFLIMLTVAAYFAGWSANEWHHRRKMPPPIPLGPPAGTNGPHIIPRDAIGIPLDDPTNPAGGSPIIPIENSADGRYSPRRTERTDEMLRQVVPQYHPFLLAIGGVEDRPADATG